MSIDRVATAQQSQFYLSHINQAASAMDKTQASIASGKNATTYAGFGAQAQVLEASISAHARNDNYKTATDLAMTQTDMQNTQLTALSGLGDQLRQALSGAVASNDSSGMMTKMQSIFEEAVSILNSKDANGDYIYAGGKTDTAPVTVTTLSQLLALPAVSGAFANGNSKKAVQVADGVTVTYGVTASDAATGLLQTLKDIAAFDAGGTGNFDANPSMTKAQGDFLTGQITAVASVAAQLNTFTAANGFAYNRLEDAQDQQTSMATLYKGFIGGIQDTNMADAATQLSLNQTAFQAALSVTATLNQLSLLNYMPGK